MIQGKCRYCGEPILLVYDRIHQRNIVLDCEAMQHLAALPSGHYADTNGNTYMSDEVPPGTKVHRIHLKYCEAKRHKR